MGITTRAAVLRASTDVHPFADDPGRPLVLGGVTFEASGAWPDTATRTSSPTP